ncbi:MAG: hypothetical protein PVH84_10190, partial [Candidatus Aminicenantes bacterium]
LIVVVTLAISSATHKDDVIDGILLSPRDKTIYGDVTFEPPDGFVDTLPLETWVSGDTGVSFIGGHGCVLKAYSFSVTGYSEPNALCYNSGATNADGTKPRLPAILKFDHPVEYISLKVGSNSWSGSNAKIRAYSATLSLVDEDSLTLSNTMQTLSVSSGSPNIEILLIRGPSVMVIDDLVFY